MTALSSPDIKHSIVAIVGHEKHVPDLQLGIWLRYVGLRKGVGRVTALSSPDIRHSIVAIVGHEKHVPDLQLGIWLR